MNGMSVWGALSYHYAPTTLEQAKAMIASLQQDALRYRYLCGLAREMPARGGHGNDGPPYMRLLFTWGNWPQQFPSLDVAIDAAMKAE